MVETLLFRSSAAFVALVLLTATAQAVILETVPVGNLGNPDDTHGDGFGAVDYAYSIGTYEVTAGQYRDFLNAVDPDGTNFEGLYDPFMDSESYGCQITWNFESSTYDFSGRPSGTEADWVDRPANYVSWYSTAMFCNWLTSGSIYQGAYDTTTGDPVFWGDDDASRYTGITPHDSEAMNALVATYGEVWVLPTEDEWYKAAYHMNDGATGNYFDYPTSSDSLPGYVTDSVILSGTGDDFIEGGTDPGNYATYNGDDGEKGIGPDYYRTKVGEWENSHSPYGTFDQGGNVWEWTETLIDSNRRMRGGSFDYYDGSFLHAEGQCSFYATIGEFCLGFRVASIPEPSTLLLLAVAGMAPGRWRRTAR